MKESRHLELKEKVNNGFLKTVSAYANYGTGTIVFGIDDDGNVAGLGDLAHEALSIENRVNDSISPVPDYSLEVDEAAGTISLVVHEGLHKPYLYRAKAYRRSGTSTIEVGHQELTRLILEGKNQSYENMPASTQDLSFGYLSERLSDAMGVSGASTDVLRTLELIGDDGMFNVAGELLADTNRMPGIDVVRYGETISIMLDRETLDRRCILQQFDQAMDLFRRYYCYEEVAGSERVQKELVPEAAFREAVANALVHREWDTDSQIRVSFFDDRIEVSSPGGLPHGLSEQEYLEGQVSKLRNPIIGNTFFRLRIIERFGTGVLRMRDAYRAGATHPIFDVFENSIRVTLPAIRKELALSEDEGRVYALLQGRTVGTAGISEATGFGRTKTQEILKRLKNEGLVEVVGVGRGTKYRAGRV